MDDSEKAYHRHYMRKLNERTLQMAICHYDRYSDEDWEILLREDLSTFDKAVKLGRSYRAVSNQLYKYRKAQTTRA